MLIPSSTRRYSPRSRSADPIYAKKFGIRSFKFYMSGMPGIVKSIGDDALLDGFRTVAALGPDAIACVHCETGALIDQARKELQKKTEGTLADWEFAHPAEAEGAGDSDRALSRRRSRARIFTSCISPAGRALRSCAMRAGRG